jgi:hypothetical protein
VCKPKKKGGLDIIKLQLQNEALLMKIMDKFFKKANLPWVNLVWSEYYANGKVPGNPRKGSFWWKHILKLLETYKGVAKADFGRGDTILLWHDLWNNQVHSLIYTP